MSNILKLPPSKIFLWILGIEAIFSLIDLSVIPGVMALAKSTGSIFPVVENLLHNPLVPSETIPYVALTCALTPAQVYVAYLLTLQLPPEEKAFWASFPSGDATVSRKIFSSIWVFLASVGFLWYAGTYGDTGYFNTDIPPQIGNRKIPPCYRWRATHVAWVGGYASGCLGISSWATACICG